MTGLREITDDGCRVKKKKKMVIESDESKESAPAALHHKKMQVFLVKVVTKSTFTCIFHGCKVTLFRVKYIIDIEEKLSLKRLATKSHKISKRNGNFFSILRIIRVSRGHLRKVVKMVF